MKVLIVSEGRSEHRSATVAVTEEASSWRTSSSNFGRVAVSSVSLVPLSCF